MLPTCTVSWPSRGHHRANISSTSCSAVLPPHAGSEPRCCCSSPSPDDEHRRLAPSLSPCLLHLQRLDAPLLARPWRPPCWPAASRALPCLAAASSDRGRPPSSSPGHLRPRRGPASTSSLLLLAVSMGSGSPKSCPWPSCLLMLRCFLSPSSPRARQILYPEPKSEDSVDVHLICAILDDQGRFGFLQVPLHPETTYL